MDLVFSVDLEVGAGVGAHAADVPVLVDVEAVLANGNSAQCSSDSN